MAWGPLETRIDELRTAASRNPAAAIESITREIEQSTRPRDRVRFLSLRSGARKKLGHFDRAEQDLREARAIRRAGKIAETELDGRFADLKLTMALATGKGWKEARELADIAVLSARELVRVKPGTSDWAIRQSRTRAALLTAALVTRGTILFYGYGLTEEALRDAREGIRSAPRWEREHNARRIAPLRSAYQLVCVCAMGHGANTEDLMLARELAVGFQIPREDVILRAQQRPDGRKPQRLLLARLSEHGDPPSVGSGGGPTTHQVGSQQVRPKRDQRMERARSPAWHTPDDSILLSHLVAHGLLKPIQVPEILP